MVEVKSTPMSEGLGDVILPRRLVSDVLRFRWKVVGKTCTTYDFVKAVIRIGGPTCTITPPSTQPHTPATLFQASAEQYPPSLPPISSATRGFCDDST